MTDALVTLLRIFQVITSFLALSAVKTRYDNNTTITDMIK